MGARDTEVTITTAASRRRASRDPLPVAKRERQYLAATVVRARSAANLSQRDLAKLAGLTQKWVSEIELGRANPALDTLAALARALKLPAHELIAPRRAQGRDAGEGEGVEVSRNDPPPL